MPSPAAREPGPLVTLVRCRTVAKVDSIGFGSPQVHPVLARTVIERQQLVEVVGDLRGGPGELRAVGRVEGLHRGPGVVLDMASGRVASRPSSTGLKHCSWAPPLIGAIGGETALQDTPRSGSGGPPGSTAA